MWVRSNARQLDQMERLKPRKRAIRAQPSAGRKIPPPTLDETGHSYFVRTGILLRQDAIYALIFDSACAQKRSHSRALSNSLRGE